MREPPVTIPMLLMGRLPGQLTEIPWLMILPHEKQALENHGQSLRKLASRGGLSLTEVMAILEDRPWSDMVREEADARLKELVSEWENKGV